MVIKTQHSDSWYVPISSLYLPLLLSLCCFKPASHSADTLQSVSARSLPPCLPPPFVCGIPTMTPAHKTRRHKTVRMQTRLMCALQVT